MAPQDELTAAFPSAPEDSTAPRYFRDVLGNVPTGVVAVTTHDPDEGPVAMVVGSFGSVSLSPPLVMFMAARTSTTFARIRQSGRFAVNVLAADQLDLCRSIVAKEPDRFRTLSTRSSTVTSPLFEGIVAWIDCTLEQVVDAGDHFIALGRVDDLAIESTKLPLLFFRGGYGGFKPHAPRVTDWFLGWG